MGWPKAKGLRLYYERQPKSYLLVDTDNQLSDGSYECIGEILTNNNPNNPQLASSSVEPSHLYRRCRRVSWRDLPPVWACAFSIWFQSPPRAFRGLWRTEELNSNTLYNYYIPSTDCWGNVQPWECEVCRKKTYTSVNLHPLCNIHTQQYIGKYQRTAVNAEGAEG